MIFDQSLQAYLHEVDDVLVAWEEKPSGNFGDGSSVVGTNYHKKIFTSYSCIYTCLIYGKNFMGIS